METNNIDLYICKYIGVNNYYEYSYCEFNIDQLYSVVISVFRKVSKVLIIPVSKRNR